MATPTFNLIVNGQTLNLIEFEGHEQLNRLFHFRFVVENPQDNQGNHLHDIADLLEGDAIFTIEEFDTSIKSGNEEINGYISDVEISFSNTVLTFSPYLHKADQNIRSEIYFSENRALDFQTIIERELQEDFIDNLRFDFDLKTNIPQKEFTTQYQESNFNFVARLCDHWGVQFYFDHEQDSLMFVDNEFSSNALDPSIVIKTASSNATDPLSLSNFSEKAKLVNHTVSIVGYNPDSASLAIHGSSSNNNTGPDKRIIYNDIFDEAEANFLADLRLGADLCQKEVFSAETQLPYLHPGFQFSTDHPKFASALVIACVHKASNLMNSSTNPSSTGPSYKCGIKAIPAQIRFIPRIHYPIPKASKVTGRIMTDSTNLSAALRNQQGDYKVELIGFEHGNSQFPWVRKAQTTAGANSTDIPLLPHTEVNINFFGSNPNCPYIESAFENSLHPNSVDHTNPHHAVIATYGTLVQKSQQGRLEFSVNKDGQVKDDSTFEAPVVNYFNNQSTINGISVITPESNLNSPFTAHEQSSGDYSIKRHYGNKIIIKTGDELHWHHGIKYDFGRIASYNFDGRYVENFGHSNVPINFKVKVSPSAGTGLDDTSLVREAYSGDLLTDPGPQAPGSNISDSIEFHKLQGSTLVPGFDSTKSTPVPDIDISLPNRVQDGSNPKEFLTQDDKQFSLNGTSTNWNPATTDIRKTFNQSYDYKFGDSITVNDRNNRLIANFVDEDTVKTEVKLYEGHPREWRKESGAYYEFKKWSKKGVLYRHEHELFEDGAWTIKKDDWHAPSKHKKQEYVEKDLANEVRKTTRTFNIRTGALAGDKFEQYDGMGYTENSWSFAGKVKTTADFGSKNEAKLFMGAETDIELYAALKFETKITVSAHLKLEHSTSKTKVKTNVIDTELDAIRGNIETNIANIKLAQDSSINIENKLAPQICNANLEIEKLNTRINNTQVAATVGGAILTMGQIFLML